VVEAQHQVATMKLVDSLAEQALLEQVIEQTKPAIPVDCRHLDYLLATPFRYGAPYPRGSRFRRVGLTPGVFYGSRAPLTAMAETAFHRLLFFAESPRTPWPANPGEFTAFAVGIRARAALDLARAPFDASRDVWMHVTDYEPCQRLADLARAAAVEVLFYPSARDPLHRPNIAVLTSRCFASRAPVERQTWRLDLSSTGARAVSVFSGERVEFDRAAFAADPRIAALGWER
jgi:hypothetical protein